MTINNALTVFGDEIDATIVTEKTHTKLMMGCHLALYTDLTKIQK